MPPSSPADELPIIRAHYDFMLWLTPKMSKFPREHRFTVGQRIERLRVGVDENFGQWGVCELVGE